MPEAKKMLRSTWYLLFSEMIYAFRIWELQPCVMCHFTLIKFRINFASFWCLFHLAYGFQIDQTNQNRQQKINASQWWIEPPKKKLLFIIKTLSRQDNFILIAQFRYIKIQPKTIDLRTRLRGPNYRVCGVYSPEPRSDVYCFRLNFKISKLGYCRGLNLSRELKMVLAFCA